MTAESGPKILPPVYLLATLLAMLALHHLVPIAQLVPRPANFLGVVFVIAGMTVAGVSAGAFLRARTPLVPFEKSTALVTSGFYRYTRNPMYLGMLIALLGVALLLGSLVSFIPIPVFVAIIHNLFIRREERFLEQLFGDEYLHYKNKVRRWL